MTDPQQPPSGAVPPVPPVPRSDEEQPQFASPVSSPAPQISTPAPPAPPSYSTPPAPPAYQGAPPVYQGAPPAAPAAHGKQAFPAPAAPTPPFSAGQPAPAYAAPTGAPVYPHPAGQQPGAPTYQAAPPGAYQVPVGGYTAPAGAYQAPITGEKKSGLMGILALILAIVAAVVTPIVAGVAGFDIGRRLPGGLDTTDPDFLSVLSPARDQVLWAEISFWTGTILGIAAIVIGIIAIRKKQARGAGITALVVAVLGPIIFWVVLLVTLSTGTATGFLP
ncbi:hypothetical protein QE375_001770 [Microbacterium foliorum]|uniref:DUF4064 domain-containing protein n=1 Tax=Microbacterium foliorum TaxID=104336 RepID=A0ABU1HQ94_9MICO|nr:hypothetical protein [Microbacterium foliorum]MDR6142216.1 hypothetical protein [Microbacterium foliorum]